MYIVYDSTVFGNIFSMLNHFRLPPLTVIISIARLKLIPFQSFENFSPFLQLFCKLPLPLHRKSSLFTVPSLVDCFVG